MICKQSTKSTVNDCSRPTTAGHRFSFLSYWIAGCIIGFGIGPYVVLGALAFSTLPHGDITNPPQSPILPIIAPLFGIAGRSIIALIYGAIGVIIKIACDYDNEDFFMVSGFMGGLLVVMVWLMGVGLTSFWWLVLPVVTGCATILTVLSFLVVFNAIKRVGPQNYRSSCKTLIFITLSLLAIGLFCGIVLLRFCQLVFAAAVGSYQYDWGHLSISLFMDCVALSAIVALGVISTGPIPLLAVFVTTCVRSLRFSGVFLGIPFFCVFLVALYSWHAGIDSRFELFRSLAVRRATQSELCTIVLSSRNYDVRRAAMERITEESLIAKIALGDCGSGIQGIAVEKLTDQEVLAEIVLNSDSYDEIRHAALDKLTDQHQIARIAVESRRFGLAAVDKLKDQEAIADVVRNEQTDHEVKLCAIRNLMLQDKIDAIALDAHQSDGVREIAIAKIQDQSTLAIICMSSCDYDLRRLALGRLRDQSLLARVAIECDPRSTYLKEVVSKITDQKLLTLIVMQARSVEAVRAALEHITDQVLFAKLIVGDEEYPRFNSYIVSYIVNEKLDIDKVSDQRIWLNIAAFHSEDARRQEAAEKLTDQLFLNMVAAESRNERIVDVAVNRLDLVGVTDQRVLLSIAGFHKDKNVCRDAVNKLDFNKVDVTREVEWTAIVRYHKDSRVRIRALQEISDEDVLEELYFKNLLYIPSEVDEAFHEFVEELKKRYDVVRFNPLKPRPFTYEPELNRFLRNRSLPEFLRR